MRELRLPVSADEDGAKKVTLRQKVLRDVSNPNTSTTLFGRDMALPIALAPIGIAGFYRRRGETQAVRAAESAGMSDEVAAALRGRDGVEQVVAFGNLLHVSGHDAARLEASIAAVRDPRHDWRKISAGLEDVFIGLMDQAKDNFA